jgi:hypothetical protein
MTQIQLSPPPKKVIPLTDFSENQSHTCFYYYWQLPKVSCISINKSRRYPGDNILWHTDGRTDGSKTLYPHNFVAWGIKTEKQYFYKNDVHTVNGEKWSLIYEAVNYINAILYPMYSWQGTWSHVYGLSSIQMTYCCQFFFYWTTEEVAVWMGRSPPLPRSYGAAIYLKIVNSHFKKQFLTSQLNEKVINWKCS